MAKCYLCDEVEADWSSSGQPICSSCAVAVGFKMCGHPQAYNRKVSRRIKRNVLKLIKVRLKNLTLKLKLLILKAKR
jgi:hypothetical protein